MIKSLCRKNLDGLIPDRQFEKLMADFNQEQQDCEARKAVLLQNQADLTLKKSDAKYFAALVHKYQSFEELSDEMLFDLVEKIEVHKPVAPRSKYKRQRIDLYFRFIGNVSSSCDPWPELSDEAYLAQVEAKQAADAQARIKKKHISRKQHIKEVRTAAAAGDEAAQAELEKLREQDREYRRKQRARKRAEDPNYIQDP